eukprot:12218736-Alexandrium_andersonii.AAC.2
MRRGRRCKRSSISAPPYKRWRFGVAGPSCRAHRSSTRTGRRSARRSSTRGPARSRIEPPRRPTCRHRQRCPGGGL